MIYASDIAAAVDEVIEEIAHTLRPDVACAINKAAASEDHVRGQEVLSQLVTNADIARNQRLPLCQDTGTVWVAVEINEDEQLKGDLAAEINAVVARAFKNHSLRMSVVHDALFDRSNTKTNTPAFIEISRVKEPGVRVHVMLKGGGSDNASALQMLPPSAGWEGVKSFVLDLVERKASSACPPLVIGVAVGSTFDKVGGLAKHALLREVGSPAQSKEHAAYEQELLDAINATGIGPGGLGGNTTALAVHLSTAPCHIAALPVAVNMGCSAMRSKTIEVR